MGKSLGTLNIFRCNVSAKTFKGNPKYLPRFYKTILNIWLESGCSDQNLYDGNILNSSQLLWNNKYITFKANPLYLERWIKAGVLVASDILTRDGQFDYQKLYSKLPDNAITQMELNCVMNALRICEVTDVTQTHDNTPVFWTKIE